MRTDRSLRRSTALALAATLICIGSTAGCGRGWPKTTELTGSGPDEAVLYVRRGYLAQPAIESVLRVQDPNLRLKGFSRHARPIEDRFIVPARVFLWLMKKSAEGRRLRLQGGR